MIANLKSLLGQRWRLVLDILLICFFLPGCQPRITDRVELRPGFCLTFKQDRQYAYIELGENDKIIFNRDERYSEALCWILYDETNPDVVFFYPFASRTSVECTHTLFVCCSNQTAQQCVRRKMTCYCFCSYDGKIRLASTEELLSARYTLWGWPVAK